MIDPLTIFLGVAYLGVGVIFNAIIIAAMEKYDEDIYALMAILLWPLFILLIFFAYLTSFPLKVTRLIRSNRNG